MEFEVAGKHVGRKIFLQALIPHMLVELGLIDQDVVIMVSTESDCPESGLTCEIAGSYMVVLKTGMPLDTLCATLAHELIHVKQMWENRLWVVDGVNIWEGEPWYDTDYLSMPWELEAFSMQEIVYRKAIAKL